MLKIAIVAGLALAVVRSLAAPTPTVGDDKSLVDYIPAEKFAQVRQQILQDKGVGGTVFTSQDNQATYILVHRTEPSAIEEHSRWDDFVIVQQGKGKLLFGKEVRGAKLRAPGEFEGGKFVTSYELRLKAGDVVRVKGGVPHAFIPDGKEPFDYLILKVRHANLPLKRVAK